MQALTSRPPPGRAAVRRLAERPLLAAALATAALALVLWAVYGSGSVGYDQLYALLWGDELAEGRLPGYEEPRAPTPHPLPNLVGLVVAPLGDSALGALEAISLLSFAALGVAAFSLGRRLFGAAVGALFAALLLTRPALVSQALIASIDVPFLALIVAAAAVEVRRPRAGVPVLALLGVAGLLRPEAWLIAGAYALLLMRGAPNRRRAQLAAITAAPPLIWMASDLAITGDPLWTFHQARATADRLAEAERYGDGGPLDTIEWVARSWKGLLQPVPAVASVAGIALAVHRWRGRLAVPLALLAFGIAGFVTIGFAGLPLLTRYFFMPAAMLCLLAAVAVVGWTDMPPAGRTHAVARAAGVALGVAIVAYLPSLVDRIDAAVVKSDRAGRLQDDLRTVVDRPHVRALLPRCQPVQTRLFRARPTLLWARRDAEPARIVATRELELSAGVLLIYGLERRPPAAAGFERVAANRTWTVLARCPRG